MMDFIIGYTRSTHGNLLHIGRSSGPSMQEALDNFLHQRNDLGSLLDSPTVPIWIAVIPAANSGLGEFVHPIENQTTHYYKVSASVATH